MKDQNILSKRKTSVIVTTHNYGQYLEACLDSIFKQSEQAYEIIIVNDASTDRTRDILVKYEKEANVQVHHVSFKSAQKSRNFGLQKSRGEYLLFVDADNTLHTKFIEKTQSILNKKRNISLVYTDHKVLGEDALVAQKSQGKKWYAKRFNYASLKESNYIDTTSLLRKEGFNGFDERIKRFQDWDAWLSYLKERKGFYLRETLLNKRLHKFSKTLNEQLYLERLKVMIKHNAIKACSDKDVSKETKYPPSLKGNIILIIRAEEKSRQTIANLISSSDVKDAMVYIRKGDLSVMNDIKRSLLEKGIIYRVVGKSSVDDIIKNIRFNRYLSLRSVDCLMFIQKKDLTNKMLFDKMCDIRLANAANIFTMNTLDDTGGFLLNRKGINKLINP